MNDVLARKAFDVLKERSEVILVQQLIDGVVEGLDFGMLPPRVGAEAFQVIFGERTTREARYEHVRPHLPVNRAGALARCAAMCSPCIACEKVVMLPFGSRVDIVEGQQLVIAVRSADEVGLHAHNLRVGRACKITDSLRYISKTYLEPKHDTNNFETTLSTNKFQ